MVCAPERTARSLAVRLNLAKRAMRSSTVAPGLGELGATSAAEDLLPSSRPVGIGMYGPLVYQSRDIRYIQVPKLDARSALMSDM